MSSAQTNFEVHKGASLDFTVTLKDSGGSARDITGYVSDMHIKAVKTATSPTVDLSEGSGITTTHASGLIAVAVTPTQTDGLSIQDYFYDLIIYNSGTAKREVVLEGKISVKQGVTFL